MISEKRADELGEIASRYYKKYLKKEIKSTAEAMELVVAENELTNEECCFIGHSFAGLRYYDGRID